MYRWIRPILFKLDAETAHRIALASARAMQFLPALRFTTDSARLEQEVWGIRFRNPIGIAAGLDKNAECIPYWARIGCGFIEVGSVSAEPAPGNPRPRAFRLPDDRALINRMGLNNEGAETIARRVRTLRSRPVPVGINLVKTNRDDLVGESAVADFCAGYRTMDPVADYVTLNVSCPNTSDGKTFEEPAALDTLLAALETTGMRTKPLLVKLSPPEGQTVDEGRYGEIVSVARSHEVDGFVASNTAADRQKLVTPQDRLANIGHGGLSGAPIAERSTALVRYLYRTTDGAVPIIGVGGVDSAEEALLKIRAGASLVQLYTGLVFEGPGLIGRIVRGIARHLDREKKDLTEIIGSDA